MSRTLDRALLVFDKMPAIAGDPIVESGSNVDGTWVNFSNGFSIQQLLVFLPDNDNNGTAFTFPFPFIGTDEIGISAGGTGINSGGLASSFIIETAVLSATGGAIKALTHQATTISNPNTAARVIATGLWK